MISERVNFYLNVSTDQKMLMYLSEVSIKFQTTLWVHMEQFS